MNSLQLTPLQLAERWNLTTKTLSQWRYNGRGPRYSKVSRLINYWLSDIEEYEKSKRCRSTSEYNAHFSEPSQEDDKSRIVTPFPIHICPLKKKD